MCLDVVVCLLKPFRVCVCVFLSFLCFFWCLDGCLAFGVLFFSSPEHGNGSIPHELRCFYLSFLVSSFPLHWTGKTEESLSFCDKF